MWIWADTFTDHFLPQTAAPRSGCSRRAGLTGSAVIPDDACCGLTWITTGQLDRARQIVERTVATLAPYAACGVPVLGLEPSCLATLRTDAVELTDDPRAADVAAGVRTLAEVLARRRLAATRPHRRRAWSRSRTATTRPSSAGTPTSGCCAAPAPPSPGSRGCCGLAGNFGMERGHYDVSVAIAESHLLPAVRARPRAPSSSPTGSPAGTSSPTSPASRRMHLAELLPVAAH